MDSSRCAGEARYKVWNTRLLIHTSTKTTTVCRPVTIEYVWSGHIGPVMPVGILSLYQKQQTKWKQRTDTGLAVSWFNNVTGGYCVSCITVIEKKTCFGVHTIYYSHGVNLWESLCGVSRIGSAAALRLAPSLRTNMWHGVDAQSIDETVQTRLSC